MAHSDFRKICCKAWNETFSYLCIDTIKTKRKVNNVYSMKAKTHILYAFPKKKLFGFLYLVFN